MKISIITTVDHNVGDDFVREGIMYLLRQRFPDEKIEFENIHKHSPITVRHGFEWFRNLRFSSKVEKLMPVGITKDRIMETDILIQSGAPVYWCHEVGGGHCYNNEWYQPLIKKRFAKNKTAKLLNLAAGTCQRFDSDGKEFCDGCKEYINEFYELSDITTVRDELGKVVLSESGVQAPVIPCSSIFAADEHQLKNEGDEYVGVNYMKGGAHYTFGQKIDIERWEKEFQSFYFKLKDQEKVIIACHNQKEVDEALALDPKANIFYKKDDYLAFMKFYSKAKLGLMNRVHGAFMMASFGKPSIIVGNDSRARMGSEIGVQNFFVNDVDADFLWQQYERLLTEKESFGKQFKSIKEKAYADYMQALGKI